MSRIILSGAVAALATTAMAGVASDWAPKAEVIEFVDQDWEDKCEGETWPIKWSKGNGKNVELSIKNSTWSHTICDDETAPGELDWEVEFCGGEYSLWLKQEECEEVESPKFYLNCAEEDDESDWGHGKPEKPTNIVVVWEDAECSCTKTKETPAPTHGKPSWYDEELKCSVTSTDVAPTETHGWAKPTGEVPVAPTESKDGWAKPTGEVPVAPTESKDGWAKPTGAAPVADAKASEGWAAPSPAAPVADAKASAAPSAWEKPAAPVADYKGAATKIGGSAFALAAVFVGALAL